jgi:dihydrofolate reductase
MRKIINSTYITLDGVIDRPHLWPTSVRGDTQAESIQAQLLLQSDALIMGRRTYEVFASAWPSRSGDPISDRINSMRKYVASSTLTDAAWRNTTVLERTDPIEEIRRLKQENGGHIVQYGFGELSHALLKHNLIDELRLWLHPVIFGNAAAPDLLFRNGPTRLFNLANTTALPSGVMILTYTAVPPDAETGKG